jgi:FAD/FMN-containing dehydrogenase
MVLMDKLNKVVSVDPAKSQLKVQAGMDMRGLLDAATAAKMSVPLIALPDYLGLSVGGVIATGATGTGQGTGTSCLVSARG